jgi:flavin reductase (DIM6/NTAB) family NADH-FMN oxidoreductase RutF
MFIVTAATPQERAGCLVGFATQCSIDPPRFLVCLSEQNRTFSIACAAELLVVHLIPPEQIALARRFGGETGDEVDKFDGLAWSAGPGGAPVLAACPNWFAGRIRDRVPAGDHWALILDPVEASGADPIATVMSDRLRGLEPGHPA